MPDVTHNPKAAPQSRLAAEHRRMNTRSKTGEARRQRARVKMDEIEREKGKRKGGELRSVWDNTSFRRWQKDNTYAMPPLCARLCAGC